MLIAAMVLFALSGWIGSSIPRNTSWTEPDPTTERTIAILVGTNGIHTEIAMPIITPEQDWRGIFPASDIIASSRDYTHVAVSWGERRFFLETPTWFDVNPVTVVRAMFGGEGVLHVAHYVRPAPSSDYRVMHLRPAEYRALAAAISAQIAPAETREVLPGYDTHDVFYTARGTYHLGNTCNQWTSDQLATAGAKIGVWSPFPGGVMKWIADFEPAR
ncbi:DUF2459 domain-containing protein [Erythrobacter sp. KY5]|uniref:DUF2459 domain-containing protein n=1 Tax=Erythrobacter sp. KY5 TaxID=2011159 RepID=UPI001F38D738|nr:DUF2459 domain-containing protein [Erythrobacter sp. KY5]